MNWPDWLRIWNARQREAITHGCELRELLRLDYEALERMPRLDGWSKDMAVCDNEGEVT